MTHPNLCAKTAPIQASSQVGQREFFIFLRIHVNMCHKSASLLDGGEDENVQDAREMFSQF